MRLGTMEILLILVLALVIFGGGKIAGVGKALGQSIREFKNEVKADDKDEKIQKAEASEEKKGELAHRRTPAGARLIFAAPEGTAGQNGVFPCFLRKKRTMRFRRPANMTRA